jgi:hypothetical protein
VKTADETAIVEAIFAICDAYDSMATAVSGRRCASKAWW